MWKVGVNMAEGRNCRKSAGGRLWNAELSNICQRLGSWLILGCRQTHTVG